MKKTAHSVSTDISLSADKRSLTLSYHIAFSDETFLQDQISATYPCNLNHPFSLEIIKNYFGIFLSQLFLSNGEIALICSMDEIDCYVQICNALYAIRNYEECSDIHPTITRSENVYMPTLRKEMVTNPSVLNLVSGGKDSLTSDLLLATNGAQITRCFIDGLNIKSSTSEKKSCEDLYDDFATISLQGFDALVLALGQISACYGHPPKRNFIPRGRDLLTISLAYPLAVNCGCTYMAHSCEKDLWESNIEISGEDVPLHDSQSKLVIEPLSKQMDIATGIHLFSPIAGMHEIYTLSWLIKEQPQKAKQLQSCFFGSWCGECTKCLRYYLIEQYCNVHIWDFKKNPDILLPDLIDRLCKPDAEKDVRFYKALLFLTGNKKYEQELFAPIYDHLFPQFFERWELYA